MSNFLGLSCLGSSPSLARAVWSAPSSSSSRTAIDLLTRSARRFSICPQSRINLTRKSLLWSPGHFHHPHGRSSPTPTSHQRRTLFGPPSIITEYLHLPADYSDATGLPFRNGEGLDQSETLRIFPGLEMTPALANELLKMLHGRRVAGTLDDPSLHRNTAMFSPQEIDKALEYLRREVPVDEILNAGLRAEDELRELAANMAAEDRGSDGEVSAAEAGEADGIEEEKNKKKKKKKEEKPNSVYGESILDRIRAANVARAEAEERAEAERRKQEEETAAQNWGGITAYDPSLHRGLQPQQLEHYEAATSDLEAPPEMPRWRVLLPTTAFVAAVLASLYLTVTMLAPPQPGSDLATKLTIGAIVALNVAVFIAWKRVRLWKALNRHFILDFVTPRPHQILTAMLTHQDPRHLLKTMFLVLAGGSLLIPEIGPLPFAATYVASGACGFLATMYTHVARRQQLVYMFGASSAGFGVVCAYFWLYRFDGFKILGLPPDPYSGVQGLGFIALIMAFFALGPMVRRQGGNVDWMSHLAGMLTGIGCASMMEPRWKLQKDGKDLQAPSAEAVTVGKDAAKKEAEKVVHVKAVNVTGKK